MKNVPAGWEGHLWAVAFNKTGIIVDTRVNPDGTYCFQHLPPGKYGLKVGHNAYYDSELTPPWKIEPLQGRMESRGQPVAASKVANVTAGHETRERRTGTSPMPAGQYYQGSSE